MWAFIAIELDHYFGLGLVSLVIISFQSLCPSSYPSNICASHHLGAVGVEVGRLQGGDNG